MRLSGIRILVIDDEERINKMYQRKLRDEGAEVSVAYNGIHAQEVLERGLPDIILLDLMMPLENGYEFLNFLRKNSTTARIPVIIVTNLDDRPDDVADLKNLGIDDYVVKVSISLNDLVDKITAVLKAKTPSGNGT